LTRKNVTVFQPNEPLPPAKVHAGWGRAKRKMDPEDLKASIWACRQIADLAERAELERRIEELEQKLAEALTYAR